MKVGTNEIGQIEMEESIGETLSEKMGDFDEVVPDIEESEQEGDSQKKPNGESLREDEKVTEDQDVEERVVKLVENNLENGIAHSPVSNGHSIVTEATIEAHDMTDLDQSAIVSRGL